MTRAGRRRLATAVAIVASVVLLLAVAIGYVQRAAGDSEQFSNRATAALRDDSVRTLAAERITDDLVLHQESDLIAARPLIESVISGVIGSRAFTSLFRAAVQDVHRTVFDDSASTVTLTIADVGTVAAAALERVRPKLARKLSRGGGKVELVREDVGSLSATIAHVSHTVRVLALVLLILSVVLAIAALVITPDRHRTVMALGIGVAGAGVALVIALSIGRSIAVSQVSGAEQQAAARAIWDAFLGDLRTAGWILAGSGATVAAAAASIVRPAPLGEPLRRLGAALAHEPRRPAWRVVRGVAFVAAGIAVLAARETVLAIAFALAGAYLVYEGVGILLRLAYQPPASRAAGGAGAELAGAAGASGGEHPGAPAHRRRRTLVPALAAVVLIAAAVGTFTATGGTSTAAPPRGPCDGHRALCDRPLDEVALPATHNSMSVPLPGWFSAEQDAPIDQQLRDGIRGLLIDTHYADRLPNGRFRTVFESLAGRNHIVAQDGVSQDAVDAALRIREQLGFKGKGERGIYLCHSFCELGATRLDEVLRQLHDFLVTNPGEVVVVVNQDDIEPKDFVAAVREAELEPLVYRGPVDGDWPTLGQMIDSDQRLVLLAEHRAGGAPWYHLAYEHAMQETPYEFSKPAQLTSPSQRAASCRPNRGPASAPLFLLNHWVTSDPLPLPSQAKEVNAYGPLLARARACERIRHRLPNLVAVNFYRQGDLMRVVDTLNGVGN